MQILVRSIAVAALLVASPAFAGYSPLLSGSPMSDWDCTHEPAVQGGAKSIEEVTIYDGKPSKSKTLITLDANGEVVRRELVSEGGGRSYVTTFKREGGDLQEVTQVIVANGAEKINMRQKATYAAKGKLSAITCERCLTKPELQPEGTTTVETAADGTTTLTMKDAKDKEQMKLVVSHDKNGRAATCAVVHGGRTDTGVFTRNAAGLIEGGTAEHQPTVAVVYEMDAKGNWTKATITQTMKGKDGKEMKQVREVVRKITY